MTNALLIAWLTSVQAIPAMVQQTSGEGIGTGVITMMSPVTAGNVVILACYLVDTPPITLVDDTLAPVDPLTQIIGVAGSSAQLFAQAQTVSGSRSFTISSTDVNDFVGCVAAEFSGLELPISVIDTQQYIGVPTMVGPPGSPVSTLPITVPVDALLFANFSIAGGRVTTFDAGTMVGEPIEISRAFNDLAAYQVATIAGPLSISAWITNNGSIQAVALRAQAPDAGFDAGIDAGQAIDAGFDAGVDAGALADAGLDAGLDAGSDAGTPDSGFIDSGMPDAGTFDAGDDAGSAPDSGTDAGLQSDAGIDAGTDLDAGHDAGAAADAGPDAGATQNDAGQVTVDAGASDAGADTLGPITVGCDCQSVPWFDVMALAGLALLLRRTARR